MKKIILSLCLISLGQAREFKSKLVSSFESAKADIKLIESLNDLLKVVTKFEVSEELSRNNEWHKKDVREINSLINNLIKTDKLKNITWGK